MANAVLVSGSTDFDADASWDTGAEPVNGDNAYLRNSSANIVSGLDQSAVTVAILEQEASFTGDLGSSSAELQIGATVLNIGRNPGVFSGTRSDRIKINLGTVQSAINIYATGTASADSGFAPVRIRGTHTSNVLNMFGGVVGIATNDPDDTAALATITQLGGTLTLGAGCTLTTINIEGSSSILNINSAFTTLNQNGGTVTVQGSGAATTISLKGGTHTNKSTGTITTCNVFDGATLNKWSGAATITTLNLYGRLDLSNATGTITVTNFNRLSDEAEIFDPLGRLTATNGIINGAGIRTLDGLTTAGGRTFTLS